MSIRINSRFLTSLSWTKLLNIHIKIGIFSTRNNPSNNQKVSGNVSLKFLIRHKYSELNWRYEETEVLEMRERNCYFACISRGVELMQCIRDINIQSNTNEHENYPTVCFTWDCLANQSHSHKNAINKAHQWAGFVRVVLTNSLSVTTRLGDATAIRQKNLLFTRVFTYARILILITIDITLETPAITKFISYTGNFLTLVLIHRYMYNGTLLLWRVRQG